MIQQRPMLDSRQQALVNQDIEHVVEMVRTNVSDAQKLLADAVNSNDPSVKAEAEVQRGNANLLLAGIPSVPGSTTRPSLNGDRSKEDLWKSAEDSFNQVTHPPLNANAEAVRNARFGLAAVAENRKEWDKARQAYQQIIDDPATPTLFRDQARAQQDALAQIQKPLLTGGMRVVGPLPDWASLPGFGQPSSTPATTPAFAPTTMPAGAPTTLPASIQPASTQPTSTQP